MTRALLALAALAAALAGASSCDFDVAYHQYCEDNPACGVDAGKAEPDAGDVADASTPDASGKPCVVGHDPPDCMPGELCQAGFCAPTPCDPTDLTFSGHYGPSTCWYGQICAADGTCKNVETHCERPIKPDGPHGPLVYDATVSTEDDSHCYEPVMVVTADFYAPFSIFGNLKLRLRPPRGVLVPDCELVSDQFNGDTWGGLEARACCQGFDGDTSGWALSLSDEHLDIEQAFGSEYCFP